MAKSPKYATNESTRDESQDNTKYPLNRLEREATPRSENARHNAAEDARVRRVKESLRKPQR